MLPNCQLFVIDSFLPSLIVSLPKIPPSHCGSIFLCITISQVGNLLQSAYDSSQIQNYDNLQLSFIAFTCETICTITTATLHYNFTIQDICIMFIQSNNVIQPIYKSLANSTTINASRLCRNFDYKKLINSIYNVKSNNLPKTEHVGKRFLKWICKDGK